MTTFKVRNNILASGGLTIPSGATFTNSGSLAVGASGTAFTNILAGTVSACFLAMANGASAAGSAVITGASPGDLVFLTTACTTGSAFITSASITAANGVTFKTYNSSSGTAAASTVLLQYLVVRPG